MLKITLIVLAVSALGIVGILAYAATRPDDFRVQRSAVIKAPPEKIFPFINDFKQWGAWSPYEKIHPAVTRSYGAAEECFSLRQGLQAVGRRVARGENRSRHEAHLRRHQRRQGRDLRVGGQR